MSHEEFMTLLQMYIRLLDKVLRSQTAMVLSNYANEEPEHPKERLHNRHNQRSDAIILKANQGFLRSMQTLQDINQKYLITSELVSDKFGVLPPCGGVDPSLPTPQNPAPNPGRYHDGRDDKKIPNPVEDVAVDRCLRWLESIDLAGRKSV
jgi:hypothetical protein